MTFLDVKTNPPKKTFETNVFRYTSYLPQVNFVAIGYNPKSN